MKKRLFLFVVSAFVTLAAWCHGEYSTLVVEMNDGSRVDYVLNQKPEISVSSEKVCITTGDNQLQVTYPEAQVMRFSFKPYDPEHIEEAELPENLLKVKYVDGQHVVISGTGATDRISLYNLNGQLLPGNIATADGETSVHIGALPQGIYLISVSDKQTFKILKQ